MKLITQSLTGTGTSHGWSKKTDWLECERYAGYNARRKGDGGLSGHLAMDVGTAGHALCSLYYDKYGNKLDTQAIKWVDPASSPADYLESVTQKANDAFRGYRLKHPVEEAGKCIAVEKLHTVELCGEEYTFRPDYEARLTEKQAALIHPMAKAGVYTYDWKFIAKEYMGDREWCMHEPRFTAYNMAYALAHPRLHSFQGTIVRLVYYGRKVVDTLSVWVPPPTKKQARRVYSVMLRAKEIREKYKNYPVAQLPCRSHKCINRFGKCMYFLNPCKGY